MAESDQHHRRGRPPAMKVLFVNENIGGHATVHHHLLAALADRPDVTATMLEVPPPGWLRRIGGAPIPGLSRLDLDLQPLRAQLGVSAWVARRLRRAASDVDVAHVYTHNAALLSGRVLRRMPSVVTLDTTNANNAYRLPYRHPTRFTPLTVALTKPLERRVYANVDIIIANSDWAARSLRDDYGVDPARIRVLPFGIIPPDFGRPAAPGTSAARPRIVFVGRQLERKGGLQLLALHQRHLRDRADLLFVTQEEVPPAAGVEVVSDLRQGDDRLWSLLRSSSLFAFPSQIDQAPNAILEAMAAGLPVVAVATGAVPEMVQQERTGLLVDGGDDAALLAALERLVGDAAERARMGAAGRRRLLERYDAHQAATALVDILGEATRRDRTGGGDRAPIRRLGATIGQLVRQRRASPGAVVLAYHDVETDTSRQWSVTAKQLRSHVQLLHRLGLRIVPLHAIVDRQLAGEPLDGLAALTFDDALYGVYEHALPDLARSGVPATVFVVSGAEPTTPPWWSQARRCLGRSELAELVAAGWTIGSHTRSHASLPSLSPADRSLELAGSRAVLEERFGVEVDLLAYPSGHHDRPTRDAVGAAGYRAALTFLNGRITGDEDPLRLPRLTMGHHANQIWLAAQLCRPADSWPDHQLDVVGAEVSSPGAAD